jgi:hypothetical protein
MIGLDRSALHPPRVRDPRHALLAAGAEIQMVLQQRAQQLATFRLDPRLQRRVLKLASLLAPQPVQNQLKPLAGASEPSPASILGLREIRCTAISRRPTGQDFISRRVNFAVTGAEVGDHVGHPSVVDVGMSNADLRHPSSLLLRLSPPAQAKPAANRHQTRAPAPNHPQIRALSVPLREPHPNHSQLSKEGAMSSFQPLLDAAGRRRSPATTPGARAGIAPRNKGQRYPADPPTVDEIVAVMRHAGDNRHGHRVNALIVVLCRAGLAERQRTHRTSAEC